MLGEEDDEKQAEIEDDNDSVDSWDAKIRGQTNSQTSLDFNLDLGKCLFSILFEKKL